MPHTMMKAVVCTKYGPPEVLQLTEVPKPVPKKGEVLINIKAAAINSGDVRVRGLEVPGLMKGVMRVVLGFSKPRKPILGTVLSGVVESIGTQVTRFQPGDEVYAMTGFNFGAYATHIALKEKSTIWMKPTKASFEEAAAIIFGGSTAIHFLHKAKIHQQPGKSILIYGASGAVGSSAIQLAKYYQAQITAVCSQSNAALVRSLGAQRVIDYNETDFRASDEKYDIIFDAVGKIAKKSCANTLEAGGVFVTVGGMEVASETTEQLELLKALFDSNQLLPVIDKTFTLDTIVAGHRYVDSGRKKGNVAVTI